MAIVKTAETRPHSRGNLKEQIIDITVATGQTSGTITATSLSLIKHMLIGADLTLTAAPTISGNTVTLAFTVASGGCAGSVLFIGN